MRHWPEQVKWALVTIQAILGFAILYQLCVTVRDFLIVPIGIKPWLESDVYPSWVMIALLVAFTFVSLLITNKDNWR